MISNAWIHKRKPHWRRLEELIEQAGRGGVGALAHRDLRELALLYRQTAADLSTVREDASATALGGYLNQLLGRAHNLLYMGGRSRRGGIVNFFFREYPRIFRETFNYTLAATLLFAAAALLGFLVSYYDPGFNRFFLGARMMDTIERREMWTHSVVAMKPLASSAIMTNNISVSLATFAMGITAGIGTVWMLLFNGLLLGVITAACLQAGMAGQLYSFVAPHGVIELPSIFIAGGAGLLMAKGLLFPGFLPRKESLARAGAQAVRLVVGIIPLLVIAGTIEGFFSPTEIAAPVKFLFAAAMFVLLLAYLGGGDSFLPGRKQPAIGSQQAAGSNAARATARASRP